MITHSVFFILKHDEGSIDEAAFLKKAMELRSISTVRNFQCARQISLKNKYKLGLIMQFEDQAGMTFIANIRITKISWRMSGCVKWRIF